MAHLNKDELKHLETLCNIHIDESQQEIFLKKLDSIVDKLNELSNIDTTNITSKSNNNSLRVIWWTKDFPHKKELLHNVKHEIINNSVVIKSALSE